MSVTCAPVYPSRVRLCMLVPLCASVYARVRASVYTHVHAVVLASALLCVISCICLRPSAAGLQGLVIRSYDLSCWGVVYNH